MIETQNGANIKLTPSPSQQKIIERLKSLIQQKNSVTNHLEDNENDRDNDYSNLPENDFDQPLSCSYYSCEEFVDAKLQAHKNFSIIHLNINSKLIKRQISHLVEHKVLVAIFWYCWYFLKLLVLVVLFGICGTFWCYWYLRYFLILFGTFGTFW